MKKKSRIVTRSPEETRKAGASLAREIKNLPALILLDGALGAGKTHFSQGFVAALTKNKIAVTSPSYSLVNAYKVGRNALYHVDLYRLSSVDDLESIGFWDFFEGTNVILIEWAEKLPHVWPEGIPLIQIKIEVVSETERLLLIEKN